MYACAVVGSAWCGAVVEPGDRFDIRWEIEVAMGETVARAEVDLQVKVVEVDGTTAALRARFRRAVFSQFGADDPEDPAWAGKWWTVTWDGQSLHSDAPTDATTLTANLADLMGFAGISLPPADRAWSQPASGVGVPSAEAPWWQSLVEVAPERSVFTYAGRDGVDRFRLREAIDDRAPRGQVTGLIEGTVDIDPVHGWVTRSAYDGTMQLTPPEGGPTGGPLHWLLTVRHR